MHQESKQNEKKKGFFVRLIEKLDRKIEDKAKKDSCCGSSDDKKGSSCC